MKNPRSSIGKLKKGLMSRWKAEDYPGAEPRFQISLFGKDFAVFVFLPLLAIVLFKMIEKGFSTNPKTKSQTQYKKSDYRLDNSKSQIIDFRSTQSSGSYGNFAKRSPGSLVRVRLLNMVETFSNAPVHAQIVDSGLGKSLMGGTLIGDAVSDPNFERINITFRFARDPNRENVGIPINARALSLDGTLGLDGRKKEGYFTRSVIGSSGYVSPGAQQKVDTLEFKDIIFKALASGFMQEFNSAVQVERNRAQVLTLSPPSEFFAELTDFFPGGGK